jgi:protein phosphatase 1 regulatory subunit 42
MAAAQQEALLAVCAAGGAGGAAGVRSVGSGVSVSAPPGAAAAAAHVFQVLAAHQHAAAAAHQQHAVFTAAAAAAAAAAGGGGVGGAPFSSGRARSASAGALLAARPASSSSALGVTPPAATPAPPPGGRLSRRPADPGADAERRASQARLFALDLGRCATGADPRTTLMVKHIPNKYTQKMLLAAIDAVPGAAGTYDFFYLPIDFKNRCGVGYAFINLTHPAHIVRLHARFHGRRWDRFNSEKVCELAYARIQGKAALVSHFQHSSLLHEDKRCRPLLFKAGPDGRAGEPEPFPSAGGASPPEGGGGGGGNVRRATGGSATWSAGTPRGEEGEEE